MNIYIIIGAGLIGAFMYGVETFILKYVLNKTSIGGSAYALYTTIIHFLIGVLIVVSFSKNIFIDIHTIVYLLCAGTVLGVSYYGYYYLMNNDSASNILQLASLESVITPLAGLVILKESFTVTTGIGVGLVITGILILSLDRGILRNLTKAVFPMLGLICLWTVTDLFMKQALDYTDFIIAYFWSRLASGIILSVHPKQITNLQNIVKIHSTREHILYTLASISSAVAVYLTLYTYSKLPLAIANPIISTYPIMLLGIMYISRKLKLAEIEPKTNLKIKLTSSSVFILGIYLITVSI